MSWNASTSSTAPASATAPRPTTWPRPTHGHLVCESCGQIAEIPGELLDSLARSIRDRYGFTLSQHRFAITGRCVGCQ